ncbi:MAG: hypothetical protein ACREB9_01460 [Thermoplasmata archaeon]
METTDRSVSAAEPSRSAELALRRLGFSRVVHADRDAGVEPAFWVQEPGVPRRLFPVFIEAGSASTPAETVGRWIDHAQATTSDRRAIVVVPNDGAAEEAWKRYGAKGGRGPETDLAILVVPPVVGRSESTAHWHARIVSREEVLRLSTGIVVGMFRRAQAEGGSAQLDFEELLGTMRSRFGVDVHRSLGVKSDEDALYLIYQLALKHAYAPGDPGSNLHLLVLKPTGPGARLPWFAA